MPEDQNIKQEVQMVVFRIKDEEFGVEISQVKEILKLVPITRMPKSPVFIEGVINLRGQIITVVDLAKRFDLLSQGRTETSRIMVVEVGENTVGMIVDSVSEVLRLSSDDIEKTPALIETNVHERYLRGVGKIDDRLLILLDLNEVLSQEEIHTMAKHTEAMGENTEKE
ncbi:MAG: chemotaxis protein CheW [PVC group bacterium]|nr:chemotaxis protein CheW [PVC group bacterium]